ncbi:hypothetical protein QTH87_22555 [Variovorax sp. J22P168]|uniref:hypothetical protein n=1 Tax=Variovorax jilinensis TaxID=3053513 RepID=UPI002578503C|nr:hypothetical protein [Variovorax sp. J22P168]MDM0015244.1 hypothetical protein [Variovorax sp. J22P168]
MIKLNTRMALVAASLVLAAATASAQGLSRAQVQEQLKAAQASGQIAAFDGEDSGSAYLAAHLHSSEPRSEVKAEVAQARADGTLNILDGTDSGSFYLASHRTSTVPRSEVKSELAAAEKSGQLDALYNEDSGSFELTAMRAQQRAVRPAVASAR